MRGQIAGTLRGRVLAIIGVLLVLLVAVAVSTIVVRVQVQQADHQVTSVLMPAQDDAFLLSRAWVDQETGERGFILTGDDTFLEPYVQGQRDAATSHQELTRHLRDDPEGLRLLTAVDTAGRAWTTSAAEPEIAARRAGRVASPQQLGAEAASGKQLFDALRAQLDALSTHINARVSQELAEAHTAQTIATSVAVAALALALLAAVAVTLVLRRSLAAPVSRLLTQVQTVAQGDLEQPVETSGPAEVVAIAEAVESMRARILQDLEESALAREQLARHAEDDRIARDLHDLVIQRLFAAGMRLESGAARHPEAAPVFRSIVDELDLSIRELRTVIFGLTAHRGDGGLRERVLTLLRDSERSLGFRPSLVVEGPVETVVEAPVADDVAASLTEILSNVARHARATAAQVTLTATVEELRLVVSDDGIGLPVHANAAGGGPGGDGLGGDGLGGDGLGGDGLGGGPGNGLRNLRNRAESAGGSCEIRTRDGGGTIVELVLPPSR